MKILFKLSTLLVLFMLLFVGMASGSERWASNSSIVAGLGDIGASSSPEIYNDSGTLKLISGNEGGTFNGYQWNGSSWVSNSSIVTGLGDVGVRSSPAIYTDGGTLKLISGNDLGTFNGYQWNGSSWVSNSSIVDGLGDVGDVSSPSIYTDGGILKLISGEFFGSFYGYQLTGSSWVSNSSIVTGIGDVGGESSPSIYTDGGILKLISGEVFSGDFYGYQLDGSSWVSNSSIVTGLGSVGIRSSPAIYTDGGILKLISGDAVGTFDGYQLNTLPSSPSSLTDLSNNLIDHTPTITWTKGTDTDGDTVSTYIYVGTTSTPTSEEGNTILETFNLGTTITLSDGVTYYYRLRSWDGYYWSDYTTADQFRMNSLPIVSSVSIDPINPNDFDDLTALNGSTSDSEGDTVTLYYKWYKDGIHQSLLDNISVVLADNTSIGEAWKVGIIPNDGYENGTEVQSESVINYKNFTFSNLAYTSPIKEYESSTITVDINDSDGTISSAIIKIQGSNYTMQYISGDQWRYIYSSGIITNHYITNIYATDNTSGTNSTIYTTDYIQVESRAGAGGGGGDIIYPTDPTTPPPSDICTLNCDDDDDGTCDRNCDTDDDGICDTNCDDATEIPDITNLSYGGGGGFLNRLFLGKPPEDFWTDQNLRIYPASLNSTAFYIGWDKPQNVTYRFITNKFIDSCEVTNGTCTIDQRFLVNFNIIIDENTTEYRGILTASRDGETTQADIYINVINLCAYKEITPWQLNISDDLTQKLVYFIRIKEGAIIGIRWWFMIALLIILLGIVIYDANRK